MPLVPNNRQDNDIESVPALECPAKGLERSRLEPVAAPM